MPPSGTNIKKIPKLLLNKARIIKECENDIAEKKIVFRKWERELCDEIATITNKNTDNHNYVTIDVQDNKIIVEHIRHQITKEAIDELIELLGMDYYIIRMTYDKLIKKYNLKITFCKSNEMERC